MSPFSSPRRFLKQTVSALALLVGLGTTSAFALTPDKPADAPQNTPATAFAQHAPTLAELLAKEILSANDIRALQTQLKSAVGATFAPTGNIGPLTLGAIQKAVTTTPELAGKLGPAVLEAFARRNQLDDLGNALANTPAARDAFAQTVLADVAKAKAEHPGAGALPYRNDVKVLQFAVNEHGPGAKDGRYGPNTDGAVQKYLKQDHSAASVTAAAPATPTPSPAPSATPAESSPAFQALAPAALDAGKIRAIQTLVGVSPTGHFGPDTATELRDFLKTHPEAHGTLGKGTVEAIKRAGQLPQVISNLARLLKENPDSVRDIGQALVEHKGSPYIFRMAVKAAGGAGDIKHMNAPVTERVVADLARSLSAPAAVAVVTPPAAPLDPALLSAPTLDRTAIKALQRAIGTRMPTGVFDRATAEKLRTYLQKTTESYAAIGKGLADGLKKAGLLPNVAADMARLFQSAPDQIRRLGEATIRNGTPPYLMRMALKLAQGDLSVKDMDKPLTTADLEHTFATVLFRTKGIAEEHPQPGPDGKYQPNPLGQALLGFNPANPKKLADILAARGLDVSVPKKAPKGMLEQKLGVAIATTLAGDPRLMNQLAKSGEPGVTVFGFLLRNPKQAAATGQILRQSDAYNTALVTDLLRYAGDTSTTLASTAKGRDAVLPSPDQQALAVRLGLALATEGAAGKKTKNAPVTYRPNPDGNGFGPDFAKAAALYLRSGQGPQTPPVRTLREQAAVFFTVAATHLKPVVHAPAASTPAAQTLPTSRNVGGVDLATLKKIYPNDPAGLVDIACEVAPQYGLRPEALLAIMDVESGLRTDARPYKKDGTLASSAHGPTQALDSTWLGWWGRFKDAIGIAAPPETQQDILDLRTDPRVAVTMLANAIKASGHRDVLSYYFEHHFGTFGNVLLNGPREALATGILPAKDTAANEYLNGKTTGDLVELYTGLFQRRMAIGPLYLDGHGPAPAGRAPVIAVNATPRPVSALAERAFRMRRDRGVFRKPVVTADQLAAAFAPPVPEKPAAVVAATAPVAVTPLPPTATVTPSPVVVTPVPVSVPTPDVPVVAVAPPQQVSGVTAVFRLHGAESPTAGFLKVADSYLPGPTGVSAAFGQCTPPQPVAPFQQSGVPPLPDPHKDRKQPSVALGTRGQPPAKIEVARVM